MIDSRPAVQTADAPLAILADGGVAPLPPLQIATDGAFLVLTAIGAALGLAIGYFAYLGYRRNESLPMLFVAVGFLLAFTAPGLLVGGWLVAERLLAFAPPVARRLPTAVALASEVVRIVGLCTILYGLWTPVRGGTGTRTDPENRPRESDQRARGAREPTRESGEHWGESGERARENGEPASESGARPGESSDRPSESRESQRDR